MTVEQWIRDAGVATGWADLFVEIFPDESKQWVETDWCVDWARSVDEFRFTLQDWVQSIIWLHRRLEQARSPVRTLPKKISYIHCVAMVGEREVSESLAELTDAMYLKYGVEDDSD